MTSQRGQAGFTLPELLISVVLMGIVTWGIGSAFWIGARTNLEWDGRMEAAGQLRNVQLAMYNDVASAKSVIACNNGGSSVRSCTSSGSCSAASPCSGVTVISCTASTGSGYTNYQPVVKTTTYAVTATTIDRTVSGAGTNSVARYVSGGGFYVSGGALLAKVIITAGGGGPLSSYTDGQLMQFSPRVNGSSSGYQC